MASQESSSSSNNNNNPIPTSPIRPNEVGIASHLGNELRKAVDENTAVKDAYQKQSSINNKMKEEFEKQQAEFKKAMDMLKEQEQRIKQYENRDRAKIRATFDEKISKYLEDIKSDFGEDKEMTARVDEYKKYLQNRVDNDDISPESPIRKNVELLSAAASSAATRASTLQRYLEREERLVAERNKLKEQVDKSKELTEAEIKEIKDAHAKKLEEQEESMTQKEKEMEELKQKLNELEKQYKESLHRIDNTHAHVDKVSGETVMETSENTTTSTNAQQQQNNNNNNTVQEFERPAEQGAFNNREMLSAAASGADDYPGFNILYANVNTDYGSWRQTESNVTKDMYSNDTWRTMTSAQKYY